MPFDNWARHLFEKRSWVTIPLGLDKAGKPKRPLSLGWTSIEPSLDAILSQTWRKARGIGIVLGPRSDNLAVIDIDDQEMADAVWALLIRGHVDTRMVHTISGRLHLYFCEEAPSRSTSMKPLWRGRPCQVELKAEGTQVAAPPTKGYALGGFMPEGAPLLVPSLAQVWRGIAGRLGAEEQYAVDAPGNYPQPWQDHVAEGDRNKAIYIEAHKLREARVPEQEALELLRLRYEQRYEQGDSSWREMANSIRSAYRKGPPPDPQVFSWRI